MLATGGIGHEIGQLSFFAADLGDDAGWPQAVAGCQYVLHVASPLRRQTGPICPVRTSTPYIRSKTIAERAAWEFVAQDDTPKLAVVNPVGIFGPTLGQDYSSSIGLIKSLLDGAMPATPRMSFSAVDVRDVAGLVLPRSARSSHSASGETCRWNGCNIPDPDRRSYAHKFVP